MVLKNYILTWMLVALSAAVAVSSPDPVSEETELVDYDGLDDSSEQPISEATSLEETYAKEFPYGQPMERISRRNDRGARKGRAQIHITRRRAGKPTTYAKKYRTWKPAKEFIKPLKFKGPKRVYPPPKRWRNPSMRRNNIPRRRKIRPPQANQLRRPTPPPQPDYEYYSEEEYFPEETKRNEYKTRRPTKKHSGRRKRPNPIGSHHLPEPTPSVSYSNFIQHPASTSLSYDYHEYFDEEVTPKPRERRRKKKKRKTVKDDQAGAYSESSEEPEKNYEKYPPYSEEEEQVKPVKRPSRHPQPTPTQATPIYGEGYIGHQNQNYQQQMNRNHYESSGLGRFQEPSYVNPTYPTNNYQQMQPDFVAQQNYNQYQNAVSNNIQVTPPNYNLINNINQQAVNTYSRPTNYNQNYVNRQQTIPQVASTIGYQNSPTTHEFSSKYKSSSFFDNTETFQDFNKNVELGQQRKSAVLANNANHFVPSSEYQDDSFINRHLELYSNGMKGVPVQGDGFGGQTRTKDYDIGYGEIQYDETHQTK